MGHDDDHLSSDMTGLSTYLLIYPREILFGCLAIFGRELVMREAKAQIETLPPAMQEKASKLMNQTVANLQDKVHNKPACLPT